MKKRAGKISKVVALAASEERRHGEQAGRSRQHLHEQVQQLGELNAYRQGYVQKNPAVSGVTAGHWQDYQGFLQRLDHAIQSQQQIVRDCEQNFEVHRQRWMVKRQKLESLQRLLEKNRQQHAEFEAKLEQKELDELGGAAYSRLNPTRD